MPKTLAVVVNPTNDLTYAAAEARLIAAMFPIPSVIQAEGDAATPARVGEIVAGRSFVHFACHASFALADVWESALKLAGGAKLTLADVATFDLSAARLVVLSACETGLTDFVVPDESIGLSTWLIRAGSAQVVSSLWSVDDVSTMLLMEHFYGALVSDIGPAQSLAAAQAWLKAVPARDLADRFEEEVNRPYSGRPLSRLDAIAQRTRFAEMPPESKPYAHPFYWAPFVVTGA